MFTSTKNGKEEKKRTHKKVRAKVGQQKSFNTVPY